MKPAGSQQHAQQHKPTQPSFYGVGDPGTEIQGSSARGQGWQAALTFLQEVRQGSQFFKEVQREGPGNSLSQGKHLLAQASITPQDWVGGRGLAEPRVGPLLGRHQKWVSRNKS